MVKICLCFNKFIELVLMVDADTKVNADCLPLMVNAMKNDITGNFINFVLTKLVMGLCGETRIENKSQSWVTVMILLAY